MAGEHEQVSQILRSTQLDFVLARRRLVPADWSQTPYLASFSRFYLIEEGNGMVEIDGRRYDPKPGELWLLPEGHRIGYATTGAPRFRKRFCHFNARAGGVNLFELVAFPACVDASNDRVIGGAMGELVEYSERTTASAVAIIRAALWTVLGRFIALSREPLRMVQAGRNDAIERALDHIDRHLADLPGTELSVERLAEIACLNPHYFIDRFRRFTGVTPARYVQRRREARARALLLETDLSIKEVAASSGFPDANYFATVFKRHTGFSPLSFRATRRK